MQMRRWLKIVVSLGLLVLVVITIGDMGGVKQQILQATWYSLVVAYLLNWGNRTIMAYKWVRLLDFRGHPLPLRQGVKIYCASALWGLFLPSTMGGDAIRAACTVREGLPAREVIASIAIERVIGALATPLLAIVSLLILRLRGHIDARLESVWWIGLCLMVGGLILFWIAVSDRFQDLVHKKMLGRFQHLKLFQLLQKSHESFAAYSTGRHELVIFFLLTIVENSFPILIFWTIGQGLGADVGLLQVAAAVPIGYFVARIPFSLGGIGVFEGVVVLVLSLANVPVDTSLAMALIARVLQILSWLPWTLVYMAEGGRAARPA
jgi:glycosyltransferase 2 family protein